MMKNFKYSVLGLMAMFLVNSCIDEPNAEPFLEDNELSITAYLEKNSDDYSMLIELLELADFKSAFNAYGTYTFFVFDNEAFNIYLQSIGKTSVSDLSPDEAKTLVRYHALKSEVSSSYLGFGKLPVKNLEDDELISEFDEAGIQGIIINRESLILTRDIELNNGMIHVLDKALKPIVESIVQKMDELGNYKLFLEMAEKTGFYPMLDRLYDTLDNGDIRRVYYTVFAETDEVFSNNGINSFADLELVYENGVSDHTNPDDSLNQFMANHIIDEKALFTKDFETGNYQTHYGELMSMNVTLDYKINMSGPAENPVYTTFLPEISNFQTKNGVFHSVNRLFDIFKPEPVEVIWGFYDQPFARDLGRVNGQDSDYYPNLDLFPNMTGTISNVFIHIPYSNYGYLDNTSLTFGAPDFDVTILMPNKIVKGKYKFYIYAKDGGGRATIQVFINDAPIGEPVNLNGIGSWYTQEFYVGEVNLTETQQNTIRLVTVGSGAALLSHVRFEPVN
jgi:uncharacterized surface protein with fasciclin (FAS1) repeats